MLQGPLVTAPSYNSTHNIPFSLRCNVWAELDGYPLYTTIKWTGISGDRRILAMGVLRRAKRHLRGVGACPPGKVWISNVLRSFLVQSGDRYYLGIHLNTDSGAVSASVDAVKRRGMCARTLVPNLNILKDSGSGDRRGGFVCNL